MPNRVPVLRRAAALVFCGVLALSACGGEEAAKPKPLPTIPGVSDNGGADVAQPSDGGGDGNATAAPAIPAPDPAEYPGMDENTPEGAEQAFRYYIATLIWGMSSGDEGELRAMYTESCNTCASDIKQLQGLRESGKFWSGTHVSDVSLASEESSNYDSEVSYLFALSPHTEPNADTGSPESIPRTEYVTRAGMVWSDGRWKVADLAMKWSPDEHG